MTQTKTKEAGAGEFVKFGTSGLRGRADDLLDGAAAAHLVSFFDFAAGDLPKGSRSEVLIGMDRRDSADALAAQTAAAASLFGFDSCHCGCVPTPCLALAAQRRQALAVMVTGSHIPADRNGLKFYKHDGEIDKSDEARIAEGARNARHVRRVSSAASTPVDDVMRASILEDWCARYAGMIADGALAGMRIGVAMGSSVATPALAELLATKGAHVHEFAHEEEFRPLDTEAVDADIVQACREEIAAARLVCVIGADPDGDRPLFMDQSGEILRGDLLGWNAATWLGADHVSTTVNANSAIAASRDCGVTRSRIGSPHVIEAMRTAIAGGARRAVGFEPNGGFLLGSDIELGGHQIERLMTRDGFLPLVAALVATSADPGALAQFAEAQGFKSCLSGRLTDISSQASAAFLGRLAEDPAESEAFLSRFGEIRAVDRTDGLRFTLVPSDCDRARECVIHLRASGNAPEFRCYVEAESDNSARELLSACLEQLGDRLSGDTA